MKIELAVAARGLATWVRNVYPLYLHDLSAFTDYYSLGADGLWRPDHLGDWLAGGPLQHALVIVADGDPAGFAFVGQAPFAHMTPARDFRLCEFFVLNRFRRRGVGRGAAFAIFDRFRGEWEVTEVPRNEGAIAFWRRVIGEYTRGGFSDSLEPGEQVQVFTNR